MCIICGICMWVLETKLGTSCLQDKHFANQVIPEPGTLVLCYGNCPGHWDAYHLWRLPSKCQSLFPPIAAPHHLVEKHRQGHCLSHDYSYFCSVGSCSCVASAGSCSPETSSCRSSRLSMIDPPASCQAGSSFLPSLLKIMSEMLLLQGQASATAWQPPTSHVLKGPQGRGMSPGRLTSSTLS